MQNFHYLSFEAKNFQADWYGNLLVTSIMSIINNATVSFIFKKDDKELDRANGGLDLKTTR